MTQFYENSGIFSVELYECRLVSQFHIVLSSLVKEHVICHGICSTRRVVNMNGHETCVSFAYEHKLLRVK